MGKLVCEVLYKGELIPSTLTTSSSTNIAEFVKNKPGVGKPFYYALTLPGVVDTVDFAGAPIVSIDAVENQTSINAMLADPDSVLAKLTFK